MYMVIYFSRVHGRGLWKKKPENQRSLQRAGCPPEEQQDEATGDHQTPAEELLPAGHTVAQIQDEPPNGGYGWVCVACTCLINGHTWGINSAYGVFLAHYLSASVFPGATFLEFAFVGGLSISVALLVAPVATNTTRLYGTRFTLLTGVFFETLSLVAASFAREVWQLFLSQGVCFVSLPQLCTPVIILNLTCATRREQAWASSSSGPSVSSRSGSRRGGPSRRPAVPPAPASVASSTVSPPTP